MRPEIRCFHDLKAMLRRPNQERQFRRVEILCLAPRGLSVAASSSYPCINVLRSIHRQPYRCLHCISRRPPFPDRLVWTHRHFSISAPEEAPRKCDSHSDRKMASEAPLGKDLTLNANSPEGTAMDVAPTSDQYGKHTLQKERASLASKAPVSA